MGWIRKQILRCVIRAIKEGDEKTRESVKQELLGLIKEYGLSIGAYNITDTNGTFTIKKR